MSKPYEFNWDLAELIMEYSLFQQLQVQPSETPLMFSEFCTASNRNREMLLELCFEKFGLMAVYPARNSVLHSFGVGRQTSLVVDIGHQGTLG